VLEVHLHQRRQRVQPRDPVVALEDGFPARCEHAVDLADETRPVGGVLRDAVREDVIELAVAKRQVLAVGDQQLAAKTAVGEIRARERDRALRDIDAGDPGASPGEPHEIDARAAADVEHTPPRQIVEGDEAQQVMQLVEVVLVEVVEEPGRAGRMPRDREIVNMVVPVRPHGGVW
jgi:hypothetical protein